VIGEELRRALGNAIIGAENKREKEKDVASSPIFKTTLKNFVPYRASPTAKSLANPRLLCVPDRLARSTPRTILFLSLRRLLPVQRRISVELDVKIYDQFIRVRLFFRLNRMNGDALLRQLITRGF
jgi:hypothetical protein